MHQQLTDERLLQLLRENDAAAFAEIYERYWERLSLYVLKVIHSSDDAGDIVQEVFVSIWKRREELKVNGPLASYLFKCVRNLAIRYIEKNITKRNFLSSLSMHCQQVDVSTVDALELRELESKFAGAIAKLPPKMQEVYVLSRQENLSYREIAQQLGIAETTVKKQVSNALKVIRVEVGPLTPTALLFMIFLFD